MASIQKSSLVDQVYGRLKQEIITLQRPLGSKLNVSELQRELGVSCTPIREAMNRLQQEGLVVSETNIGARVLSLTKHDILEIQQLAYTLHSKAVELSMEIGDRERMEKRLEQYLEEYRKAKTPAEEVAAVHELIGTFYYHCGNSRLSNSMLAIQGQQLLLRHLYARQTPERGLNLSSYKDILTAAQRGNAEEIQRILGEITDRATQVLLQAVEKEELSI